MSLFLTAISTSKPGHAEDLKTLLLQLVKDSRAEPACIQYDLHQSLDDENMFIFHEEWADEKGFEMHNNQEHLNKFREKAKDFVAGKTIKYITRRLA